MYLPLGALQRSDDVFLPPFQLEEGLQPREGGREGGREEEV